VIASLTGEVAEVSPAAAVVDVAGVGYLVHAPAPVLAGLGRGQHVRSTVSALPTSASCSRP